MKSFHFSFFIFHSSFFIFHFSFFIFHFSFLILHFHFSFFIFHFSFFIFHFSIFIFHLSFFFHFSFYIFHERMLVIDVSETRYVCPRSENTLMHQFEVYLFDESQGTDAIALVREDWRNVRLIKPGMYCPLVSPYIF